MAGKINHRFVSTVPDEGVATEFGPNELNDSLVVSGGADGQHMVRRTAQADGWELRYIGADPVWINATQAANSGTGETDLHVFTLGAAYFDVNKRKIRITAEGSFAANANTKTLRLRLGAAGVIILNQTTVAPNGLRFKAVATITRTALSAQRFLIDTKIGTLGEVLAIGTAAETDTGALVAKITGQSAVASSDILLDETMIEFLS